MNKIDVLDLLYQFFRKEKIISIFYNKVAKIGLGGTEELIFTPQPLT